MLQCNRNFKSTPNNDINWTILDEPHIPKLQENGVFPEGILNRFRRLVLCYFRVPSFGEPLVFATFDDCQQYMMIQTPLKSENAILRYFPKGSLTTSTNCSQNDDRCSIHIYLSSIGVTLYHVDNHSEPLLLVE